MTHDKQGIQGGLGQIVSDSLGEFISGEYVRKTMGHLGKEFIFHLDNEEGGLAVQVLVEHLQNSLDSHRSTVLWTPFFCFLRCDAYCQIPFLLKCMMQGNLNVDGVLTIANEMA
jgi:hypothetical protein